MKQIIKTGAMIIVWGNLPQQVQANDPNTHTALQQNFPGSSVFILILLVVLCGTLLVLFLKQRRILRQFSGNGSRNVQHPTFDPQSQILLEALPVGIAIYDKNARQEYINDALALEVGLVNKEAHLAKHISLYEDPILSDEIKERIRQGEDIDTTVEYNLQKASTAAYFDTDLSHNLYLDGKVRYIKNNRGEIEKYILIVTDSAQAQRHKLQWQRSEINLRLALETGQVDVWCYDIPKAGFYPLHGHLLTREGASIEEVASIMYSGYKERFIETMNDLLSGKIKEASYMDRIIQKQEPDRYYKTRVIAVYSDQGTLETVIGSHKDITDYYYHQQALEESLLKVHVAIKNSNIVQWTYDCQTGWFSVWNATIAQDKPSITAEDYLRAMHPEDVDIMAQAISQMQDRQDVEFSHDIRIKLPEHDRWQYVTIGGTPIKDDTGRVIKFTGFRRNNTKFIQLNEQLKETNIHLNMILQAGDIIPLVWDTETDMMYVSPEVKSLSPDQLARYANGMAVGDIVVYLHPEDRERIQKMLYDLKSGIIQTAHEECRYDPNGVYDKLYEINYIGIDYDKNQKPQKIVGYLQNITQRKKNETEIRQQKELLNNILDKIPVPLSIKDMEDGGKYIYWNAESRKVLGEGLLKSVRAIVVEEQAQEIEAIDKRVFETEEPYIGEERIRKINGQEYDTIVHKCVIYNDNKKLLLNVRWDMSLKKELQRKSKILSISMNALKAFTWYCDLRDGILRFGDELEDTGAYPLEMNSMEKFAQKIHPHYRESFITFMNDFCQQENGEFSVEYEIDLNGDGHYEWWECRGTMDTLTQGNLSYKYLYGMDINIDKLKRSELDILKNKSELDLLNKQNELILNNTNSGLVFLNNDFVVQWENLSSFMPDHPMARNYKKGMVCHKIIKGLDVPCPNCVVMRSLQSDKIELKEVVFNEQVGELTATPIYDDSHHRIGTVLKVSDITENRRVHRELETAKNRAEAANVLMNHIIDCLPCLLFIKDVTDDYRHVMVNKQFCEVLGKTKEEIIGKTDYDLFPTKEEADKCRRDDEITSATTDLHIFEEATQFQGKRIIWQTTKTWVKTTEGRQLMIAVALDITEKIVAYDELQDAKEKAEQSNRLKSAFLANMSHEIRTPLNAIVGFSELMMDTSDPVEKREYSKIVHTNNELLLRLINDILDLSKIEAGMFELRPVRFDVAYLFNELFAMFEKKVNPLDVKLICENPYVSCTVEFDKNRFTQVMTNFVTNAIKFTPQGEIRMGYEYIDHGLKVFVSDTGIGIAKNKIDKVFERFEKLDDFAQGTGLGMAICKAIMETHNGKIGVESEQGVGSTFWAWMPIDAEIVPYEVA